MDRSAKAASSTAVLSVPGTVTNTSWKTGCAPAPFTERLATYRLRLRGDVIEVDSHPLPPGTRAAISNSGTL
jgi:hypothetical protein